MEKYFKIIDKIAIEDIIKEIDLCPESAWRELDQWVNPQADKIYALYKSKKLYNEVELCAELRRVKDAKIYPDPSREQERLHVIWQFTSDQNNSVWWIDPSWRMHKPMLNPKFGKYFPATVNQLDRYWKSKNKTLSRLFFSRLQPGKQVYPHSDGIWGGNYANNQRYGLVLTTNEGCTLTVGSVTVNPDPGTLYWFDSREIHSAVNPTTAPEPRIFLYMDVDQG